MLKTYCLKNYSEEVATATRELLIELSRSKKDKGEIPESWFREVIASPYHDLLIAEEIPEPSEKTSPKAPISESSPSPAPNLFPSPTSDDPPKILGIATLSVVFGAGIQKNAYLEDFVVSSIARGKGVGSLLWEEMLNWAREHGCNRLEFTSGKGREAAQTFYLNRGAEIYETNYFRKDLK